MENLNPEIVRWFAVRGKDIPKLTDPNRMPRGITAQQVEVAAIRFYNSIATDDFDARILVLKSGNTIKYLNIAWEIWRAAKEINAAEYTEAQAKAAESASLVLEMDEKHREFAEQMNSKISILKKQRLILVIILWLWFGWELFGVFKGAWL